MQTLKKIFLLLMMLLGAPTLCRANIIALNEADKLYQSGEIQKAAQLYRAELESTELPVKLPASFFFNYGTMLARTGAMGEAYIALLRAAYTLPFDGDIRHNLWRVEQTLPSSIRMIQPAIWYGFWPRAIRVLPWQALLLVGLVFSALLLSIVNATNKSFIASLGAVTLLLLSVASLSYLQARLPVYGVIKIAQVKSGPGLTFTDITTLEPGALVNEDASRDGWRKIRFTKGQMEETVGWVQPTVLLQVF